MNRNTKKCPKGQILRDAYIRKTKSGKTIKVPASYIKDKGLPGKRSIKYKKIKHPNLNCPEGEIARAGYTRVLKNGKKIKISPSCIKDRGTPGKGLIILPELTEEDKGLLKEFGYKLNLSKEDRYKSLKKAIKQYPINTIIWHLNYLRNITANDTNKDKFKNDMKFVQSLKNEK